MFVIRRGKYCGMLPGEYEIYRANKKVWNVKDGWGPVCEFLEKPTPNEKFPVLNESGSNYVEDVIMEKKVIQDSISELKKNLGLSFVTFGIFAFWKVLK